MSGGLEESVTDETLRAAFVPFGEIIDVNMPVDNSSRALAHGANAALAI